MPRDLSTPEKELRYHIEALMSPFDYKQRLAFVIEDFSFSADYPAELQKELEEIIDLINGISSSDEPQNQFEGVGRLLLKLYKEYLTKHLD